LADEADNSDFQLLGIPSEDESHALRSREPFELLATQFVEDLRNGRKPTVDLYAKRFPLHAAKIREVFPVLAMLEQARLDKEAQSIRRNMPERFPITRLGNCELLCELGRGGMGVVYQAKDIESGHLVAVKILPWRVSVVPEWVDRFEREARTAARLRHKNIVPVFRYGQENGYCYFVMQLVIGVGLDRVIHALSEKPVVSIEDVIQREVSSRRGYHPIPALPRPTPADPDVVPEKRLKRNSWMAFVKIAIQATQALRAAHASGILHNDIKPGNLLLDAHGRVWVTDFGLSRHIEPEGIRTSSQSMGGTLKYMAPERLKGEQNEACDLYSLGATLYELCLQTSAFEHYDRDELIRIIRDTDPVPPRTLVRDFPRGLETIIQNSMARNPANRYRNADMLLADLLRFSRNQSVRSMARNSFFRILDSLKSLIRTPQRRSE